jgi:hypothetical protein
MKQVLHNGFRRWLSVSFVFFFSLGMLLAQGVSTSEIRGKVYDDEGIELIGANVMAIHQPSGTTYGTSTDVSGRYRLPNVRVGGPYEITVSYTGYEEKTRSGIQLNLGEPFTINFKLGEASFELQSIEVVAKRGSSGENAGAGTSIGNEAIEAMPTLNRDLNDFTRLTPQATESFGGGFSIAGTNNRYNAIYFDGAVNNDVFGLAANGTNGGQTGIAPISIDAIDQMQVVISPYDVSYGGFAGGGINAVTKSGTNTFKGGAYYYLQNESLAGKTNKKQVERSGEGATASKLDEFSNRLIGVNLGGPIIKDKLFFFVNAEIQNEESPRPFQLGEYLGNSSASDLDLLRSTLIDQYGYDPGPYGNKTNTLDAVRLFAKVNWNINNNHDLMLRHNYVRGEENSVNASGRRSINYLNNGIFFPTTTNSTALELNSRLGLGASNNLIIGYTTVRDDRDPIGQNFPAVTIDDGNDSEIQFGSEPFSTANQLDQDVLTLTNNFKLYRGDHTITIGTHNEYINFYNLFIRQNFGSYNFNSLDDFLNDERSTFYTRSYSLVDDVIGDGSAAAAEFSSLQLGFYIQDDWEVSKKFSFTYGLRLDIPMILDDPAIDTSFNSQTIPAIEGAGYDLKGARGGAAPDGQLMWSPRIGFNWDINGDRRNVIRGGAGVFTSRIPFVWPGGMYTNNGVTVGGFNSNQLDENPRFLDIEEQYEQINTEIEVPSGQVDLFTEDFKFPQIFRANLALDKDWGNGWFTTVEAIYSKTINNVFYQNVNSDPTVDYRWTNGPNNADDRPVFTRSSIDDRYSAIYLASNTSKGYTYTTTAQVQKRFAFGLNLMAAYTYGDAYAIFEGTSSQNSSQWRGAFNTNGRNFAPLGRSDFSMGNRIIASADYGINWNGSDKYRTSVSIFYNGQSGMPFSYVYGTGEVDGRNINQETGSTSRTRSLIYIPEFDSDIVLVEKNGVSPEEQWASLNRYIEQDDYLRENRGSYAEKNGSRSPFTHVIDLKFTQNFAVDAGGREHRFQFTFDVFNVANLINSEWGVIYGNPFDFNIINYEGQEENGTTPQFSFTEPTVGKESYNIANVLSRWRGRIGVRYIFN